MICISHFIGRVQSALLNPMALKRDRSFGQFARSDLSNSAAAAAADLPEVYVFLGSNSTLAEPSDFGWAQSQLAFSRAN